MTRSDKLAPKRESDEYAIYIDVPIPRTRKHDATLSNLNSASTASQNLAAVGPQLPPTRFELSGQGWQMDLRRPKRIQPACNGSASLSTASTPPHHVLLYM